MKEVSMKIVNWNTAPLLNTATDLEARLMADSEQVQIVQFSLSRGEEIPLHVLPFTVFFVVLEGEGTITIGAETATVGPGTLITCPGGADRGWKAAVDGGCRVLAVKSLHS